MNTTTMSGSDKKFELQYKFKKYIMQFIEELVELCPDKAEFFMVKIFVKDKVPLPDIIERFVSIVLPYEKEIKAQNDDFFLTTSALIESMTGFEYMAQDNNGEIILESMRNLWQHRFDSDDKEAIWKWLNLFIKLGNKYKKDYME